MNKVERKQFLKTAQDYLQHILALLYLCGGAPPGATEMASLFVCNTADSRREVFALGGSVFIASLYGKQRSLQKGLFKPVLRYLDLCSSRQYKCYAIFVRPIELIIKLFEDGAVMADWSGFKSRSQQGHAFGWNPFLGIWISPMASGIRERARQAYTNGF